MTWRGGVWAWWIPAIAHDIRHLSGKEKNTQLNQEYRCFPQLLPKTPTPSFPISMDCVSFAYELQWLGKRANIQPSVQHLNGGLVLAWEAFWEVI